MTRLEEQEWYQEEDEVLSDFTGAEHNTYSFEGLHNDCYIRLESSDVKDIIKSLKELYEEK